jgi:hypothetical protein
MLSIGSLFAALFAAVMELVSGQFLDFLSGLFGGTAA